jgi:lysophospholipase L1-like esterase
MSTRFLVRGAFAVALVGGAAACSDKNADVLGPRPSQGNGIFQRYVALGNSITAGYQSGGINDSTQRRSYAALVAAQMGTRYAYASVAMPGCPPPISNFLTQARFTPTGFPTSTSTSCYLRTSTSATDILNNVAVPGATSFDPNAATTAASNVLTTLILGGRTQVQRAVDARPTFATVWIGNNDVLGPALSGILTSLSGVSPGVTPQSAFQTNYDQMISQLQSGAPGLKGVLLGVGNVTSLPILFSGRALQNSQFVGALSQAAGKTITPDLTTCTASTNSLVSFLIVGAIRANQHPATIACEIKNDPTFPLLGNLYVLDSQELASLATALTNINTYISGKAQAIGFGYLNPNKLLDSLKALNPPQITSFGPDFTSATAPFGKWVSLDGVHPSSAAHQLLTNYLIDVINATYSTSLVKLPNP